MTISKDYIDPVPERGVREWAGVRTMQKSVKLVSDDLLVEAELAEAFDILDICIMLLRKRWKRDIACGLGSNSTKESLVGASA